MTLRDETRRILADAARELKKGGSEGPPCPACGHSYSTVLQSRSLKSREDYRRRRKCCDCGFRFTSYEAVRKIA